MRNLARMTSQRITRLAMTAVATGAMILSAGGAHARADTPDPADQPNIVLIPAHIPLQPVHVTPDGPGCCWY